MAEQKQLIKELKISSQKKELIAPYSRSTVNYSINNDHQLLGGKNRVHPIRGTQQILFNTTSLAGYPLEISLLSTTTNSLTRLKSNTITGFKSDSPL